MIFTRGAVGAGWDVQSVRGGTPGASGIIKGRAERRELAFIQRIVRKDTKASVTMCSGTGAGATLAGAEWLSRKYRQLDRRCGNGEYGVLLAYVDVTDPHSRFPEGIEPKVLAERARWLIEICKQEGFRFSPRLHIDLWGNRRGK